jgi:3-phenylpropionate/trans-cinnamate dioxygenase ferredoxin subunit
MLKVRRCFMGGFIEVARSDELRDGVMESVNAAGQEILLARIGDKYYAAGNRCPHMGGNLAQGKLAGTVVTCPKHGSQFDLSNGQVVRWLQGSGLTSVLGKALKPPRPLAIYKTKVADGKVMIEL